ncbi:VanZ family protein [Cellulomonas sp. NPDC055163]
MQYTRIVSPGLIAAMLAVTCLIAGVAALILKSRGYTWRDALVRGAAGTLLTTGAAFTAAITLVPVGAAAPEHYVEWNALKELGGQLADATVSLTGAAELAINFLLLSWIGLLLPVLSRSITLPKLIALVIVASLSIEILQYAAPTGRIASAGDVLLNVTGGILASILGVIKLRPKLTDPSREPVRASRDHQ